MNKHFASVDPQSLHLLLKQVFTQKWLDNRLLLTSRLVTIATDHQ